MAARTDKSRCTAASVISARCTGTPGASSSRGAEAVTQCAAALETSQNSIAYMQTRTVPPAESLNPRPNPPPVPVTGAPLDPGATGAPTTILERASPSSDNSSGQSLVPSMAAVLLTLSVAGHTL